MGTKMVFTGLPKGFMAKLTGVCVILTLFGSCRTMVITPVNRSEALSLFKRRGWVSISNIPIENAGGPVFRISGQFINNGTDVEYDLMIAGQTGMELNYKYFFIIASDLGSITVVYTNDGNHAKHYLYNTDECSALLDGRIYG
ncbi:MAG: hypothetical protein LBP71_06200 [Spirochaetaceae bacterium]|jgi:hypothetical protein|nr:hypothetical protein [Spirochaetaceae bacterium]